ncbi:MAG: hypothetical protein Q9M17_00990 [Mariprofundus sp.]|nr:hypothetical protein [Mariprofundus sp.]
MPTLKESNLTTKYVLEIYEPNDDSRIAAVFTSGTPFMTISKGEYINTSAFTMSNPHKVLKVTSVEHILWEVEGRHRSQKICIRTNTVENPFK